MEKMEIFKENLEEAGFTNDFIVQTLHYFNLIKMEKEVEELNNLLEAIDYYNRTGSFTCNSLQSFYNLHNFTKDLAKLYNWDNNNILNYADFFEDIEKFEIQVLYVLYFEFYPQEEEEEIN